MFLDDQLYARTKLFNEKLPDNGLTTLINDLYKICEAWYHPQLNPEMTYAENKVLLDRLFRFWDVFAEKVKKERPSLGMILSVYSYKKTAMEDSRLKAIYERRIIQ